MPDKITKKAIRAQLALMSRALLNGDAPKPITLYGFRVTCSRLYNGRGCIGPAWNPYFSLLDLTTQKIAISGNLTSVTDALYRRLTQSKAA